jgi:hypothetical protein
VLAARFLIPDNTLFEAGAYRNCSHTLTIDASSQLYGKGNEVLRVL